MTNRIRELREKNKMTLLQLSKKLGVSESTVQRYESGNIKNLKYDTMVDLANIFRCNPAYLMGWDNSTASLPPYDNIRPVQKQKLPVLGRVAAGKPIMMEEEREVYVETPVKADFILIVQGDSMTGARINDGDIVFVRQQAVVENGEIAVIAIDDEATLKRFYKYDDLIVLRSENPEYKDMEFRPEDGKEVRILGKAVKFQSDVR